MTTFFARAALVLGVGLLAAGCGGSSMQVQRLAADEAVDVSGKWNDTDSRMVSEEMIGDCLSNPWIEEFMAGANGQRPVVVVGKVVNKTDEHIQPEVFVKDLERAFLKSGRVRVVTNQQFRDQLAKEQAYQASGVVDPSKAVSIGKQLGANFLVFGTINAIKDRWEGREVVFYQTNLELHNVETSEVVWIGDKKIKKLREQSGTAW
jgi:uncharacterized protein (TIGR02722 family)